ncbi:hypothetical protein TNCV_1038741 [Trichonephila clavipes]|uniref:Uncharacterized protein n=1 Tax=Trichonephila clavipes TaxID=2585209 RepID=A0A8X6VWA2_TRICX|nr:hypothetical protein TNCV_1038741 [Trichonephila clavipes]
MRMDIELISDKPIKTKPYRMSPRQINILREEIKRLLELGVIEIGQSDYTSPLILVESPNKDPRPCVDYRRLNEITRAEFFPLPNMEEIVEKGSVAPYVMVMDLSKGYFQIPLTPRAQRYAAFVTPFGTYIPKKMMFGLVCAPYYFCKLMAQVLEGLEQFALPYIDDIAIFSQGWKDHVKHIDIVLGRLRKAGLKHNSFTLDRRTERKIKKEKITWDEKCGKAFEELKAKLVTQPILFAPDFATDFILQTDASEVGAGVVLSQRIEGEEHPIVFLSKKFSKAERNYSTVERELAAIIFGLKEIKALFRRAKIYYRNRPQPLKCCMKRILETGGVMGQCAQMWTRNYGALDQRARVCFGVLCANRKKEEVKRDFGPANKKKRGACCEHTPGV